MTAASLRSKPRGAGWRRLLLLWRGHHSLFRRTARALYDIPNIQYDGYRVLTNKPACGAMRGHGTVNVRFAFESQLDELAPS